MEQRPLNFFLSQASKNNALKKKVMEREREEYHQMAIII
jgi:hypothetical protein